MRIVTQNDVDAYSKQQARLVKVTADFAVQPEEEKANVTNNDYLTKLVNYIPVPVVAAFLAIDAAIKASSGVNLYFYWGVVIVLAAGAGWYAWTDTKKPPSPNAPSYPPSKIQTAIAVVSFVVWVYAIGGPFASYSWYQSVYAVIIVILWVFIVPILVQPQTTSKKAAQPSS
jgi:hypothetical protein